MNGIIRALSLALAAGVLCLAAAPGRAEELTPTEAGQEARDGLRSLMDQQRKDKASDAAKPKPEPPKPQPGRPSKSTAPPGGKLPAVCIGCGVK